MASTPPSGGATWSCLLVVEPSASAISKRDARGRAAGTSSRAGCMLYWPEGDKSRHRVALSNSDPEVLRFFARFLRNYFDFPDAKFRVSCNLFADHVDRQHEVEQFWRDRLDLPRSCLRKSVVNRYSKYSQKKRMNRLPYGTCRLSVHSTAILQHIYGAIQEYAGFDAIQEYAGFDRPEWLG